MYMTPYYSTARILAFVLIAIAILFSLLAALAMFQAFMYPHKIEKFGYSSFLPSFPLFQGNCSSMQRVNAGIHLLLNLLATVVIGISMYIQQLCTSPTREDISTAIKAGGDVDFGSNLPFQLFRRWKKRKIVCLVWIVLILTSLPIHLTSNASIGLLRCEIPFESATMYPVVADRYFSQFQGHRNLSNAYRIWKVLTIF